MNTTSKFLVLTAVGALMIGAIVVSTAGSADADRFVRNIGDRNLGQQNTGDTSNSNTQGVGTSNSQTANGGNAVGGDLNAAGNCDDCEAGD